MNILSNIEQNSFSRFPSLGNTTFREEISINKFDEQDSDMDLILKERKKFKQTLTSRMQTIQQSTINFTQQNSLSKTNSQPSFQSVDLAFRTTKQIKKIPQNIFVIKKKQTYKGTQIKRQVLVIYDRDLMSINNLFKIVYCTSTFPSKQTNINDWTYEVLKNLNIKSNKNYLFDKDGNQMQDLQNFWGETIIISNSFFFPGLQSFKYPAFQQEFDKFINKLEKDIKIYNTQHFDYEQQIHSQCENLQRAKIAYNNMENVKNKKLQILGKEKQNQLEDLEKIYDFNCQFVDDNQNIIKLTPSIDEMIKKEYKLPKNKKNEEKNKINFQLINTEKQIKQKNFVQQNLEQYNFLILFGQIFLAKIYNKNLKYDLIYDFLKQFNQRALSLLFFLNYYRKYTFNHKSIIKKQQELNTDLFLKNIPQMLQGNNFTRRELYDFYSLFKILSQITALTSENKQQNNGVGFNSYYMGIQENFQKGYNQAKLMFDNIDKQKTGILFRNLGTLNEKQFMDLVCMVRNKSKESKIEMFFKTVDSQKSLNKFQITEKCKNSLQAFIKEDIMLNEMSKFFASHIFQCLNLDENKDSLNIHDLKDKMLNDNEENQKLLSIFFGV